MPSMAVLTAFAVSELKRLAPPRPARVALVLGTIAMCVQPAFLVTGLALITDRGRFSRAAAYIDTIAP